MKPMQYATILAFLVLATGMSSAVILEDFGSVAGSVNVGGPTFYASNDSKLLINEPPNATQKDIDYIGSGFENVYYSTAELNKEWYPVELNMSVEARKVINSSNTTFDLNFYYTNSSGSQPVCPQEQTIQITSSNYSVYSTTCTGNISGNVESFQYVVDGGLDTEAYVKTYGNTKVEFDSP